MNYLNVNAFGQREKEIYFSIILSLFFAVIDIPDYRYIIKDSADEASALKLLYAQQLMMNIGRGKLKSF